MWRFWLSCAVILHGCTLPEPKPDDLDGDGFTATEDCDDLDPAIGERVVWYADLDMDGWGISQSTLLSCSMPDGHVRATGDCDDEADHVHPGATEVCDGRDTDCNGHVDDVDDPDQAWYLDRDDDGFGDPQVVIFRCEEPGGYVQNSVDCDDEDPSIHPDAPEWCDQKDNDCDAVVDNEYAVDATLWYEDLDGDGYGEASSVIRACTASLLYVDRAGDCAPNSGLIHPGAEEIYYDGVDQDCDGASDFDADRDGYDQGEVPGTDCDDQDPRVHPSALDYQDGRDNDCNNLTDLIHDVDGDVQITGSPEAWYVSEVGDLDQDGHSELLVRVPGLPTSALRAGAGYLFSGPLQGQVDLEDADVIFLGSEEEEHVGVGGARLGDVNGDGYADMAISSFLDYGSVFLFYGPVADTASLSSADVILRGGHSEIRFGAELDAGDFTGDGISDLLVSALGNGLSNEDLSAVSVIPGPIPQSGDAESLSVFRLTSDRGANFGRFMSACGDVNGDGIEDFLVGEPGYHLSNVYELGAAYLVLGPATGSYTFSEVDIAVYGEDRYDYLGEGLAGGDLDGDGYDDVFIGSAGSHLHAGPTDDVFVYTGAQIIVRTRRAAARRTFALNEAYAVFSGPPDSGVGMRMSEARDFNDDGFDDVLIGASGLDEYHRFGGAAYLILGPKSGTYEVSATAHAIFAGSVPSGEFGVGAMFLEDGDGDKQLDVLVHRATPLNLPTGFGAIFRGDL